MIGDNNLKVSVVEQDFAHNYAIYFYYEIEDLQSNKYRVIEFKNNTEMGIKEYEIGETIKPSLILSKTMLKKMGEAIQNIGIQLPEKSKIEGLYEASQKHLEDMRKIVFKGK